MKGGRRRPPRVHSLSCRPELLLLLSSPCYSTSLLNPSFLQVPNAKVRTLPNALIKSLTCVMNVSWWAYWSDQYSGRPEKQDNALWGIGREKKTHSFHHNGAPIETPFIINDAMMWNQRLRAVYPPESRRFNTGGSLRIKRKIHILSEYLWKPREASPPSSEQLRSIQLDFKWFHTTFWGFKFFFTAAYYSAAI